MLRLFAVLGFLFMASCAEAEESNKTVHSDNVEFNVVTITDGLNHPWSLTFLPGRDYLVSERRGKLWRISQSGIKKEITGVPTVYHEGQGGLLDIALEPGFKNKGWLYFSYAAANDEGKANTEVVRARLNLDQNRLTDLEVIFRALPKVEGGNHWGSRLLFAPDGMLHVTLGERFDYKEEAQNPHNHLGTTIRLTPSGAVPDDNPFVQGQEGSPEVFTYGNRNVQGMALNPRTREIWINEHGPKGGDEINILKPSANYGWPAVTYGVSYWGTTISDKTSAPGIEDPVLHWTPSIAPSGMAFYTGDKFPPWQGDAFVGALAHKHLRRLELNGNEVIGQEELLKDRKERIRDVREGPDGYIYVLTDEPNGSLLRLEPVQ
jgi:glucose/arabinose dehydrogenase